jgi:hypothetical protein
MADDFEDGAEAAGFHLSVIYKLIVLTCADLPIPIQLPQGMVQIPDAVEGVRRVADIIIDQPIPEEMQAEFYAGCAYWLSAVDILGLQVANPEINRLRQVAACMVAAEEGIRNIARWVRHQKLDAEGGGNQQE